MTSKTQNLTETEIVMKEIYTIMRKHARKLANCNMYDTLPESAIDDCASVAEDFSGDELDTFIQEYICYLLK